MAYHDFGNQWQNSGIELHDDGITGFTKWGWKKKETLAWTEIEDVKLDLWSGGEYGPRYIAVIPKNEDKRTIILPETLSNIGELVNLIKEKAGLLKPIPDIQMFLSVSPRAYPYETRRLWRDSSIYWLLGITTFLTLLTCLSHAWRVLQGGLAIPLSAGSIFCCFLGWQIIQHIGIEVVVSEYSVVERRRGRTYSRINWHELSSAKMECESTILNARDGRRLTVLNSLRNFDQFNQIVRLQKEHLRL